MQPNFVSFANLTGTLEPYGDNLILKLSCVEGKSDAAYLSRAVNTLLNFGAIDFVPEIGEREYENLRPYNAGVDSYAMLQTSAARLKRALTTLGAVQAYSEWMPVLDKRDTSKRKVKGKKQPTVLFGEISKLVLAHSSGFQIVESERCIPSDALPAFNVGTI